MINLTATARIHYISPVMQVTETFQKRDLILDDSWGKDGKTYPSYVLIEFTGDKIAQLDSFMPGQIVTVEAFVTGREYQGKYYNSIRGKSVAPYQPQTQGYGNKQAVQAPAPGYAQHGAYHPAQGYHPTPYPQQPQYPGQGGYAQQPVYQQAPAPAPMPGAPQGGNLGPDNLPFR